MLLQLSRERGPLLFLFLLLPARLQRVLNVRDEYLMQILVHLPLLLEGVILRLVLLVCVVHVSVPTFIIIFVFQILNYLIFN